MEQKEKTGEIRKTYACPNLKVFDVGITDVIVCSEEPCDIYGQPCVEVCVHDG